MMSPTRAATSFSVSSILRKISFQKLLMLAVIRLCIYMFKLVEDTKSVQKYHEERIYGFMLVSAACLIIPPVFYSIYLMGQNLTKDDVIDNRELGTKAVNGLLLMPWQIKRHLDVLHYAAQRVCQFRGPDKTETQDLQAMERNAEILEFFEDIYAGFIQILLQTFLIFDHNYGPDSQLSGIPNTAIVAQLVASCLSVSSMLIAVRRRDDGPLTGVLSLFGWTSLFISRVLVISLAATVLKWFIVLLALIHVLAVSMWVYNIAVQSHLAGMASPPEDMTQWAGTRRRVSTAIMTFLFFGIPSLVIWPIMFQLKERRRPLCYLIIITVENLILLGIWFVGHGSGAVDFSKTILIGAVVITTLAGVFFLMIYVFCKPKYTDQVVLFEIRESRTQEAPTLIKQNGPVSRFANATQYGIYYEFCDLVFKLPSTHKIASDLEEIRALTRATHPSPPVDLA